MTTTQISAKQAVEEVLAQRIAEDPNLISALSLDPDGVVKPLIAEITGDDGEIDLSDASITVHVETENRLHFVVSGSEAADVQGFGMPRGASSSLRGLRCDFPLPPLVGKGGGGTASGPGKGLETHSGVCICASEDCETQVACDLTNTCK